MGFLGFFNFAFTCFHLFALPLFALGYPLCASIRAIETNSNYHMRNLVTYWIIFSLISLFELTFVKLIEWIPLWPYIKLGTICCLVLPRFNGAHYCYKSFIQPCLSVNLEEAMRKLYKRQKTSVEKDNFLSVAEKYVTENGTEALEKLIANKGSRTGFDVEDIKAVAEAAKHEMPQMVKGSRTDFGVEKIKAVAETEKKEMLQTVKSKGNEFKVDHKGINRMEQPEKSAPVPENSAKKKTIAAVEVKEMTKPQADTEEALPAKTPLEKVQKEWTCAVCQVITCEANLNSHLTGKKHRAKCEELKLKTTKQTTKVKASPSNPASKGAQDEQSSKKPASRDGLSQDNIKNQNKKVQVKVKSEAGKQNADNNRNTGSKNLKSWCPYCSITCMSETDFLAHLTGKKHLARIQDMAVYPAAGVQGWDNSTFPAQEMAVYPAGVQGWDNSAFPAQDMAVYPAAGVQGWDNSTFPAQEMAVYPAGVQGWDNSAFPAQDMAVYPAAGVQGWDNSTFPAQKMAVHPAGVQGWE